jgi:glycosyltransferase involved in cell wall biosynthesis
MREPPKLSVGIPTYNRAAKLARAIESVLAQTHTNLELVVVDDASSDVTEIVCTRFTEHDARVRYLRSPTHRGATANFNLLAEQLRGDYVTVLADDEWFDRDYLERCSAELARASDAALAYGRVECVHQEPPRARTRQVSLDQASASGRVLACLGGFSDQSIRGWIMPRRVLQAATPLRDGLANEQLLAAALVVQGRALAVETTAINRELKDGEHELSAMSAGLAPSGWQSALPHLAISWELLRDIGWRAAPFRELSWLGRKRLSLAVAWAVTNWSSLARHLLTRPPSGSARRP